MNARLAIVVIGRNEGQRLRRCLEGLRGGSALVVYVDSGSSDGSAALARDLGVHVVELDAARPFTAARARNEGLARAAALLPEIELVQFVDGDCELVPGWLERGVGELEQDPTLGVAFGRVRERERERSVYNLLCDLEWRGPAGEAPASGGNAMMRIRAVQQAGGFDPSLIAGEEPELARRLRRAGWRIVRFDADMAVHDAAMTRFAQWWRRGVRGGWAYAEGASLHRDWPERYRMRENASILIWGALLPAVALLLAWPTRGASLLLLGAHALLGVRIHLRGVRAGLPVREAALQAFFTVLGKLPEAIGQLQFTALRALGRRRRLVDWRVAG